MIPRRLRHEPGRLANLPRRSDERAQAHRRALSSTGRRPHGRAWSPREWRCTTYALQRVFASAYKRRGGTHNRAAHAHDPWSPTQTRTRHRPHRWRCRLDRPLRSRASNVGSRRSNPRKSELSFACLPAGARRTTPRESGPPSGRRGSLGAGHGRTDATVGRRGDQPSVEVGCARRSTNVVALHEIASHCFERDLRGRVLDALGNDVQSRGCVRGRRRIAQLRGRPSLRFMPLTNERSILSSRTGRSLRYAIEENPVPKSSILRTMPIASSVSRAAMARSGSVMIAPSVSSRTRCAGGQAARLELVPDPSRGSPDRATSPGRDVHRNRYGPAAPTPGAGLDAALDA